MGRILLRWVDVIMYMHVCIRFALRVRQNTQRCKYQAIHEVIVSKDLKFVLKFFTWSTLQHFKSRFEVHVWRKLHVILIAFRWRERYVLIGWYNAVAEWRQNVLPAATSLLGFKQLLKIQIESVPIWVWLELLTALRHSRGDWSMVLGLKLCQLDR